MSMALRFGVLIACLGLLSCNKDTFPKYAQLGDLRVLTIKALADQSEVNPGTTVTLQPVISDLNGGGRTLSVEIQACIDPGVSLGAQPQCAHPDTTTSSSFATSTLSTGGTFTGDAPTFTIAVPALPLNFVIAPAYLKYNGVAYLIIYTVKAPDGTAVTAFKRLLVSDPSKTTKNKNPAIGAVTSAGAPLANSNTYSAAATDLGVTFTTGAETYQVMGSDGSLSTAKESLTTTWFFTDGTMKFQRTGNNDSNHWEPSKPGTRAAAIVVITHDGHGGEDYRKFEFN